MFDIYGKELQPKQEQHLCKDKRTSDRVEMMFSLQFGNRYTTSIATNFSFLIWKGNIMDGGRNNLKTQSDFQAKRVEGS